MRRATRGALGAIALGATALVGPLVSSSPAMAHAPCGRTASDLDTSAVVTGADQARLRSGSSTGCTALGVSYSSHRLNYYCWTRGNDGYTWTYLRNDSTGIKGWSRDDNLPNGGSYARCGF